MLLKVKIEGYFLLYLQTQKAVIPVHPLERYTGFYSALFQVPKRNGGWRLVIDLKKLNLYIHLESFKMEPLQTIIRAAQSGDWMLSMDLQDAYLHIPILAAFKRYLKFVISQLHLQFWSLLFGLCSSPRVFIKFLNSVLAPLRERGLRVFHYVDDIMLLANSLIFRLVSERKEESAKPIPGDGLSVSLSSILQGEQYLFPLRK